MKQDVQPQKSIHNTHATGAVKLRAHLAMLSFSLLVAGSFSLGGMAAQHMPAAELQFIRYMISIVVMAGMAFIMFRQRFAIPVQPWRFAIYGMLMGTYMLTMFLALEITSPVQTGAVFTLMPLASAAFAFVILKQHTRPGVFLSLVIAASGAIWVIFRGDVQAILRFDIGKGELIYFVGVLCHAAYVPLLRKLDRREHPTVIGFWLSVAVSIYLLFPAAPQIAVTDFSAMPPIVWTALAYLSVVTTAITFLLIQYGSMRLPAPKVLAYNYLTPSFIIILEGLIGHGWASPAVFAGALVTACGLIVTGLLPD
ncbi:DMT family transporter [Rhizobium sp. PAMB 3182]